MRRAVLLLLLLSGGCQRVDVAPMPVPPPPVVEKAEVITEPVVMEPVVPPPPPKPRFVIENIMDLAPDTLENILGKPSLKRKDKNVRVWLYQNGECRLHLYFYPDDNGDFRLDYVATTAADMSADNPTVSPNGCLASFVIPDRQPSYPNSDINPQPDR